MQYSSKYQGLFWTHHVIERMRARRIPQQQVWEAIHLPSKRVAGKTAQTNKLHKYIDGREFTVIVHRNVKKELVVLSCWVEPPFEGSIDFKEKKRYREFISSRGWRRLWIRIKQSLGLFPSF